MGGGVNLGLTFIPMKYLKQEGLIKMRALGAYIIYLWASSENSIREVLYKTTMAGLEGLPQKVALVHAKGTLDFAKEVS